MDTPSSEPKHARNRKVTMQNDFQRPRGGFRAPERQHPHVFVAGALAHQSEVLSFLLFERHSVGSRRLAKHFGITWNAEPHCYKSRLRKSLSYLPIRTTAGFYPPVPRICHEMSGADVVRDTAS
eukprot:166492-Rhodomonas_salina.3